MSLNIAICFLGMHMYACLPRRRRPFPLLANSGINLPNVRNWGEKQVLEFLPELISKALTQHWHHK